MDFTAAKDFVKKEWDASICESLTEYVRIPNQSPMFDREWETNGLMEKAMDLMIKWVDEQQIPTLKHRVLKEPGRTPLLFITIDGVETDETVLMYGHMDKQPPFTGWNEGLGPYEPKIIDGKLYGRGGADDGYCIYASLTAVKALKQQGIPHARIALIVEACEESGSFDLGFYVQALKAEIGNPSLVVCLDSGAGNYEQLWLTSTLRGMLFGILTVEVSSEGVHSGMGSGIIPSSFRIIRELLDRIEDSATGKILLDALHVEIPEEHVNYANKVAGVLGDQIIKSYPFLDGVKPMTDDPAQALLNRCWRPTLSYTGAEGLPSLDQAGNVLRPKTSIALSFRLPPTLDSKVAYAAIKKALEENPPYGAKVSFVSNKHSNGWKAPAHAEWLDDAVQYASNGAFGKPCLITGEGGSIPFFSMLGEMFPTTQFCITGVLGPNSNAHGPNEFLHIEMFHGVAVSIAGVLEKHYQAKVKK